VAGGFAVFPDKVTGRAALLDCLKTTYANKSIDQLVDKYAPIKTNPNNPIYKKFLHKQTGVLDNKKIKNFTSIEFEKLWKAIEQFEGWKEGNIVEVYKISLVRTDAKNVISSYYAENFRWFSKQECINLAKQGKIEAEICTSILGNTYLRSKGSDAFQKDFHDLIEQKK
jgi:hypothetical protein